MITFCYYRINLLENGQSKSNNFGCSTLGRPQPRGFEKN